MALRFFILLTGKSVISNKFWFSEFEDKMTVVLFMNLNEIWVETVKSSSNQIFALNIKENTIIEIFRNMPKLSIYPDRKLIRAKNIILLDFSHIPLKMKK